MHTTYFGSSWVCLMMAATALSETNSIGGRPIVNTYNQDIMALEQEWNSTNQISCFIKARELFVARSGGLKTVGFHTSQLDLAAAVLFKSRGGKEFQKEGDIVFINQGEIIDMLAIGANVSEMEKLAVWPELRSRYALLMMCQRATSISLRDPTLDDKMIQLDSTVRWQPLTDAEQQALQKKADLYERIHLQHALKSFMKDTGPRIDRFMVDAFSREPFDIRMLNELLAMGLYTPEERAKLVTIVAEKVKGLPDTIKTQLP